MARYDKYEPKAGGFRAVLEAAIDGADIGVPLGVGLNASGRVVKGGGTTGVLGVLVVDSAKAAGDVVDVMTAGEVVDVDGLTAGTVVYADAATAALGTDNTDTRIGHTAEASRLVVRVAH
jgi:hypothetical protein